MGKSVYDYMTLKIKEIENFIDSNIENISNKAFLKEMKDITLIFGECTDLNIKERESFGFFDINCSFFKFRSISPDMQEISKKIIEIYIAKGWIAYLNENFYLVITNKKDKKNG